MMPLEQQPGYSLALSRPAAMTAAILHTTSNEIICALQTLDCSDISDAEDIVKLLKPLKVATNVLCERNKNISHNPLKPYDWAYNGTQANKTAALKRALLD